MNGDNLIKFIVAIQVLGIILSLGFAGFIIWAVYQLVTWLIAK